MVAGHLEEKYGIYYIVLSYKDSKGKRKVKWESTGLPVKRNKKKAEALLLERRSTFIPPVDISDVPLDSQILFADFMLKWLEIAKSSIQITTYASYQGIIQSVIDPYFRQKGIRLIDLKATDIQEFYTKQLERVSANSVLHYHANIHKALKYAVKVDLIPTNPADKVERPKKKEFQGNFYNADEINDLLKIVHGTKLEIPVLLGAFYGLRRSEILGLKWDAINFESNTLEVRHILTQAYLNKKEVLVLSSVASNVEKVILTENIPPEFQTDAYQELLSACQKKKQYQQQFGEAGKDITKHMGDQIREKLEPQFRRELEVHLQKTFPGGPGRAPFHRAAAGPRRSRSPAAATGLLPPASWRPWRRKSRRRPRQRMTGHGGGLFRPAGERRDAGSGRRCSAH